MDKSKDFKLPGAGSRRSSKIGRRRASSSDNKNDEPSSTAAKVENEKTINPLQETGDTASERPSHRPSTKDLLVDLYEDITFGEKIKYYLISLMMCFIPFMIYGAAFTQIGYGIQLLTLLKENSLLSNYAIGAGMLILITLYLFDFSYWKDCWKILKNVLLVFTLLAVNVGIWTMASSRPQLPLFVFYLVVPAYFAICKQVFLKHLHESHFLAAVSKTYFTAGIVSITVWVIWQSQYAESWTEARLKLNGRLFCTPYIKYEMNTKQYLYCSNPAPLCKISSDYQDCIGAPKSPPYYDTSTFGTNFNESKCITWSPLDKKDTACQLGSVILYFSMLGTAFVAWFFGCICLTLSYVLAGVTKNSNRLMKIFGFLLVICFTGFYLASALNMANTGLSDILMTFSIFGCFAACGFLAASLGWRSLEQDLKHNKGLSAMGKYDSLKGWLVLFFGWAYLIFFVLSSLNQCFRKCMPCAYDFTIDGKGMEAEKEKKLKTTLIFYNLNQRIKQWNHTSVLVWVQIWAILYFLGNIFIGKVVYVVLSMLSDWMQNNLPFIWVCVCFYFVGLFMFLNPAIPGVPVYLVGGVVITRVGESTIGFGMSAVLVCAICFTLKLNAVVVQQKIFGEMMAEKKVWIRALIGINSPTTRAIKKILMVPGMNLPKIVILCGGPDWPTSVTTGILKCNVFQMLLGTLPIIFLIIPTVMTGAFKNKEQDGPIYATLSGIFMASTSVVQGGAMLLAGYYIQQSRTKHFEELSRPDESFDKEVDDLDKLSAAKAIVYKKVTKWEILPGCMKANLLIGTFLSVLYTYFFAMGTTISPNLKTFKAFELSDSVATKLDGNPFSIVESGGWAGLALVTIAMINYKLHSKMAAALVKKHSVENGDENSRVDVGENGVEM